MKAPAFKLAILAFALSGGKEVKLVPAGTFKAQDGRGPWTLSDQAGAEIAAKLAERAGNVQFLFDYEHQTQLSEENGKPAPAAGWATQFQYRPGDGIYALDVDWTEAAAGLIERKEYRYISPVIAYDKQGNVTDVLMAAITNFPALDSLGEIARRAELRFSTQHQSSEEPMALVLSALIAACGFPANYTEEQAMTGLATLKADADKSKTLEIASTALKLKADKVPGLESEVEALKKQNGVDPAKYVPIDVVTGLRNDLAKLAGQVNGSEVETVVQDALKAGKLAPAMTDWARDLGKSNIEALKKFVETAPAIAALTGMQTGGKTPPAKEGDDGLTDDERAACLKAGITAEEFKKSHAQLKAQGLIA